MNNFKLLFISLSLLLVSACIKASTESSCEQEIVASPCVDPSQADPNAICTTEYDPVCGCNDTTYSNACVAASNGVQAWVEGECCE